MSGFLRKAFSKSKDNTDSSFKLFHSSSFEGRTFLHGHLDVDVRAARDLPDMEGWVSKLVDRKDVTDAFVDVRLGPARLAKTSVVLNNLNPEWNEDFRLEVCHFADDLVFEIKDKDHAYAEYIGSVSFPTSVLLSGETKEGWFPIRRKSGSHKGKLHISLQYISIASLDRTYEVQPCYFPMQRNCEVTLYQNAHCPKDLEALADLRKPSGKKYKPDSCWKDVHKALLKAKHIICITGWSVWHELKLLRGNNQTEDRRTLGEILVDKSEDGVKVYVMIWSDKTNFMGTHDDATQAFFKNSKVNCALVPRELQRNEFTDYLQNEFSSGTYTHHQKSIICDAPNPEGALRRLVAFVGGLDLTGGRWDTPDHELFKTLLNEHKDDFYQNNAPSIPPTQGPRQPWRDIHAKVEGPIAHDVFLNFFERWNKQGKKHGNLFPIDLTKIDVHAAAPSALKHPRKGWNVQLFRSITSDSANFDLNRTQMMNSKKGRIVDSSIAQAYIKLIRNADNFIYIENQYFLGSAYCWLEDNSTNCNHTIPSEITQKVVDKIFQNQRFCAYIVIPMFPEGNPASAPSQEVLHWQTKTIEMMYKRIGEALRQAGHKSHPTDWLLFLCPGKREAAGPWLKELDPPTDSVAKLMRTTLRGPIYVHSKMMIVDDVYLITGSANINQRSMAGTRDTEIAVGCWQPHYTDEKSFGEVHSFRMELWTALLRNDDPILRYPGTHDCVTKVQQLVHDNWNSYIGPDGSRTKGLLLPYPLSVLPNGFLENLQGIDEFPDFPSGSKIMGKKSAMLPQKITT